MNKFRGFDVPKENWSKLPHQYMDHYLSSVSGNEHKVLTFILRHTWGYQDESKRITIDEFVSGRKKKDGTRFTFGTGMSANTVRKCLATLKEKGFIEIHTDESDRARIKKTYSLKFRGSEIEPLSSEIEPRTEIETNRKKGTTLTEDKSSVAETKDQEETKDDIEQEDPSSISKDLSKDKSKKTRKGKWDDYCFKVSPRIQFTTQFTIPTDGTVIGRNNINSLLTSLYIRVTEPRGFPAGNIIPVWSNPLLDVYAQLGEAVGLFNRDVSDKGMIVLSEYVLDIGVLVAAVIFCRRKYIEYIKDDDLKRSYKGATSIRFLIDQDIFSYAERYAEFAEENKWIPPVEIDTWM